MGVTGMEYEFDSLNEHSTDYHSHDSILKYMTYGGIRVQGGTMGRALVTNPLG